MQYQARYNAIRLLYILINIITLSTTNGFMVKGCPPGLSGGVSLGEASQVPWLARCRGRKPGEVGDDSYGTTTVVALCQI